MPATELLRTKEPTYANLLIADQDAPKCQKRWGDRSLHPDSQELTPPRELRQTPVHPKIGNQNEISMPRVRPARKAERRRAGWFCILATLSTGSTEWK